ncbi:MAG: hypothetical protein AAFO69_11235, partial [Bacteroidota bacterium]
MSDLFDQYNPSSGINISDYLIDEVYKLNTAGNGLPYSEEARAERTVGVLIAISQIEMIKEDPNLLNQLTNGRTEDCLQSSITAGAIIGSVAGAGITLALTLPLGPLAGLTAFQAGSFGASLGTIAGGLVGGWVCAAGTAVLHTGGSLAPYCNGPEAFLHSECLNQGDISFYRSSLSSYVGPFVTTPG